MSEVMTQLREEHRNIAKVLRALEHQLSAFDAVAQPDYDVLAAIADYFVGFPDRCHHPKEDLIYRRMRERDASLAQTVTDLGAEHRKISAQAREFQQAVSNVIQGAETSRSTFDELVGQFLRDQRRHMQLEEEQVFPLALQILTPDDWVEIDAQVTREEDPVFGAKVSREFAALRDNILKWERESEAFEG